MVTRENIKNPKQRIITVCVKLFIEKGFKATTMLDIIKEADVSSGTFQNIFRTKDGVLKELIDLMFKNQFGMANVLKSDIKNPVYIYALETAIQLAIVEMNEHLREIYVEVYTQPLLAEYIYEKTSSELFKIFSLYNPTFSESDFYESEIGSAGMMRAFMLHKCDKYFTLKKKIEKFLSMSLKCYSIPNELINEVISNINEMAIEEAAKKVMNDLFSTLEMTFNFKFDNKII